MRVHIQLLLCIERCYAIYQQPTLLEQAREIKEVGLVKKYAIYYRHNFQTQKANLSLGLGFLFRNAPPRGKPLN